MNITDITPALQGAFAREVQRIVFLHNPEGEFTETKPITGGDETKS